MEMYWQLLKIAALTALISATSPAIIYGSWYLVVSVVAFPITLMAVYPSIVLGHRFLQVRPLSRVIQLAVILVFGFVVGSAVYGLLFFPNILEFGVAGFSAQLLYEYGLLGTYTGAVAWVIYAFSPLRIVELHSNHSLQARPP